MTDDKMLGWHYRLDGHGFQQAPGVGDGQGSLAGCSPRGRRELDTIERTRMYALSHTGSLLCSLACRCFTLISASIIT